MAQTTTAFTAIDSQLYLDDDADALQDISGSSNKAEANFENMVGELNTFGSRWKVRTVAGKDVQVTLDIVGTTATDEAYDLFKNWFYGGDDSARSLRIDVPDSTTGNDRYEGEFVLESLSLPLDAGDANPVKLSATLRSTGAVTLSTITS